MEFTEENFIALTAKANQLASENQQLRQRIDWLLRKLFGRSSEKIHPGQLGFNLEENGVSLKAPEAPLEVDETVRARSIHKRGKRIELPADLPVVEERIIPEEVLAEPAAFRQIGEEVFEQLDITPARCFKRRIIRPKFVRIDNRSLPPVIAPAPGRVIENSIASAGLLAEISCGKYIEHQPLYRQEQSFKRRFGILISRKLMSGWMYQLAQMLAMIYESLRNELRACGYLQVDETPVRYLNPGTGKCGQGYLWVYNAPKESVLFEWHTGRGGDCMKKMLLDFSGFVQNDGYVAYDSFRHRHGQGKITAVACMAHMRRNFHEAQGEGEMPRLILDEIAKLYQVEARLRENPKLDRRQIRQEESVPVLESIKATLLKIKGSHLPKSLTGKAIDYALARWEQLMNYTEHAELEIDNNLVENAIRPTAVGKKNWLFFGSAEAGQTSAIFYSLIGSCKALGLIPEEYLRAVYEALPGMTNQTAKDWTPAAWRARRRAQDS
jgi:transposase